MNKVRTIAFYLPQFHPIPENDEWWGKGFTEWTNVKKAEPLFDEHYQPHVPHGDIGYYDLRDRNVQKKQMEIAKNFGIHGFCYYHYWFDGKKLLETPLQTMLKDPEIDFPFCVCWANENWTRRWDGNDKKVLIAQNHNKADDRRFIQDLMPVLKDKRYILVDGKPLVLIYRPALLPDSKETMKIWREEAQKNGFNDLFIVRVENFDRNIDSKKFGCDAGVKFAPNFDVLSNDKISEKPLTGTYDSLIMEDILDCDRDYPLYKSVCPSWDNAARRQDRGGITFVGANPEKYQYWLEKVLEYTMHHFKNEERLVFINAWNEWGEGAHLEPDTKFGYEWLEATRIALRNVNKTGDTMMQYKFFSKIHKKIKKLERVVQKKGEEVSQLREIVSHRDHEIHFFQSSKFWKMRELHFKIKFMFLHPMAFAKKYYSKVFKK